MDDLLTVIISLIGSAVTSFLVAKYYGERWVEVRRNRNDHSIRLKDDFLKPWLDKIEEFCKVDARYSTEIGEMVPLEPQEANDLKFYDEARSHLETYKHLIKDWNSLKQNTLELNKELAIFFEETRVLIKKKIDLPYYCRGYYGDEPDEYICPDTFIRAIFDEILYRIETGRKQFVGNGTIVPTIYGEKKIYHLRWSYIDLARSPDEELMKKTQQFLSKSIEDEGYRKRIKTFMAKKETYDKELEKVKQDISDIIKSIELGNIIKGKCRYCP